MAVRTISTSIKVDGGNEFKRQLNSVNSELRNMKSEMSLVTAEFKGNANSMEALTAKGQLLRREYDQQAEKVRGLESAVEEATKAYGEADKRTDRYKRELISAKTALVNLNAEIQDNERYLDEAKRSADGAAKSIDEYGRAAKSSSGFDFSSPLSGLDDMVGKLGALKGALVGGAAVSAVVSGVQALTGAITDVVDGSEEYRKVMGTLEVSSQAAGYTGEETAQIFEHLYSVLGDTQTAATTTANLQAIGLSQEDLIAITDAAIGAWALYGDSIPIDGLGEAINETIQAGQVTGTFADVLNWAGVSEDSFNKKLAESKTATERANLVLQELARQGLIEAGQSWQAMNGDIMDANESQLKFEEAQARLGEQLSPIRDGLRDLGSAGLNFLADVIDGLTGKENDLQEAQEAGLDSTRESTAAIEENAQALSVLTEKTEEQKQLDQELTQIEGLLGQALQEQSEQKSLSLDTTLALIDAGYATAIAVDTETGAVRLNKEAYIAIAKAKIDDQIASLETQRTSVQNVLAMKDEAIMATDLGKSYYSAAEARKAMEGQKASYDAQIAALNQLRTTIGNYKEAALVSSQQISTASKTQAQRDLEQFRAMKSELDHLRNMDELSEREYYDKLSEYRDRYLTDDDNVDEYRKITEQIYEYDKSLAEEEAKLWEEQTEKLAEELQDRVDTIQDHQQEMTDALSGYGDLFNIEGNNLSLENIQDQIDAINEYEAAISGLRDRNVADGLMDAVLNMDVDEATQYAEKLLSLTDEQFNSYNDLWSEKQQRAKEVAEEFYSEQLDALGTEYNAKLGEALSELTQTAFDSGQDTVEGLLEGLSDGEQELYQKAQDMVDTISEILAGANVQMSVSTPIDGSHAGGLWRVPYDGYVAELHRNETVLNAQEADVWRSMQGAAQPVAAVTAADLRTVTASAVNALGTMGGGSGGRYVIELHWNVNGKELARETIEDFRSVNREIPEVMDDR